MFVLQALPEQLCFIGTSPLTVSVFCSTRIAFQTKLHIIDDIYSFLRGSNKGIVVCVASHASVMLILIIRRFY